MSIDEPELSQFAQYLIQTFEKGEETDNDRKITVNPVISKFATWYEKLRNAMDYREEEVILRAAIERILRRRLLFGGTGRTIAEPLVRELVWAKYFPDETLSEQVIGKVEKQIDLYLKLRELILNKHKIDEKIINELTYHLMSSGIENILHPHSKRQLMSNFMFQVLKDNISVTQEDEQTKNAQTFIAIRKSFNKDDLAFLRYHLFNQYFGSLKDENVEEIANAFSNGYKEIQRQLNHPRKEQIYNYIRKKTAVFFILEDILGLKGDLRDLYKDEAEFKKAVFSACEVRYSGIKAKVRTAIIRSVIFILLTKAFFAFGVEGTYEKAVYGGVIWGSLLMNLFIPPVLMVIVGLLIKTPGKNNSERIFSYIKMLLSSEHPKIGNPLVIKKQLDKTKPAMNAIFTLLWLITFVVVFGFMAFVLTKLNFNIVSQAVFIFFIAIVSFFSYRISQSANAYTIESKSGVWSTISDFLFMPFIQVGRKLTEGISQINILLFILDFAIETPFKGLFSFFEQWFQFLQAKREKME